MLCQTVWRRSIKIALSDVVSDEIPDVVSDEIPDVVSDVKTSFPI